MAFQNENQLQNWLHFHGRRNIQVRESFKEMSEINLLKTDNEMILERFQFAFASVYKKAKEILQLKHEKFSFRRFWRDSNNIFMINMDSIEKKECFKGKLVERRDFVRCCFYVSLLMCSNNERRETWHGEKHSVTEKFVYECFVENRLSSTNIFIVRALPAPDDFIGNVDDDEADANQGEVFYKQANIYLLDLAFTFSRWIIYNLSTVGW